VGVLTGNERGRGKSLRGWGRKEKARKGRWEGKLKEGKKEKEKIQTGTSFSTLSPG